MKQSFLFSVSFTIFPILNKIERRIAIIILIVLFVKNVDVNEMINTDERIHFPFSVQEVANRMIIIVAMTK